jgi:hypothetical protein
MVTIKDNEDFVRDWDWYAVDEEGHIGHFTTAGLRLLPVNVREDRERLESLERYFFETAPVVSGWTVRKGVEVDAGGWKDAAKRDRYLRFFVEMASKGLFSYDTELVRSVTARYFLVSAPESPLTINDLPESVKNWISRTRAPLRFREAIYISEADTTLW